MRSWPHQGLQLQSNPRPTWTHRIRQSGPRVGFYLDNPIRIFGQGNEGGKSRCASYAVGPNAPGAAHGNGPAHPSDSVKTPSRSSCLAKPEADSTSGAATVAHPTVLGTPLLRIRQVNHGHTGTLHLQYESRLLVRRWLVRLATAAWQVSWHTPRAAGWPEHPQTIKQVNHIRGTLRGVGLWFKSTTTGSLSSSSTKRKSTEHEGAYRGGQHFCTEFDGQSEP